MVELQCRDSLKKARSELTKALQEKLQRICTAQSIDASTLRVARRQLGVVILPRTDKGAHGTQPFEGAQQ